MRVHTKSFESDVVADEVIVSSTRRIACMSEEDFDDACSSVDSDINDYLYAANDFNESYF